jgi:CheY-like chemotaxis protein
MHILVADDEPLVADILAMILKSKGHSVKTVPDGAAALDAFRAEPFDLVLTDLSMPNINGLALAREIKDLKPSQTIALLTGSADENLTPPHVDYVLAKPVDMEKLTDILRRLESPRG